MDVQEAAEITTAALEGAGIQASTAVQLYIAQVVLDAYEKGRNDRAPRCHGHNLDGSPGNVQHACTDLCTVNECCQLV